MRCSTSLRPCPERGSAPRRKTHTVAFDPYAPYGPLVESTLRVVSWNVWGRYGEHWAERQRAIEDELAAAAPDVVCLVESWRDDDIDQPALVATRLGFAHHCFVGDWEQEDWISGAGAYFFDLRDRARYPRSAFFDTQDHLNETAQIMHSVLVAEALTRFTDRPPAPSRCTSALATRPLCTTDRPPIRSSRSWRGEGFTRDRVPMRTVGTVSSPPVTDRTKAAPAGSSQMLISSTCTPARFSLVRSRQQ